VTGGAFASPPPHAVAAIPIAAAATVARSAQKGHALSRART
jgi:hypothetical protein